MQNEDWMYCTLCRSGRTGKDAYKRAKKRAIDWPPSQQPIKHSFGDPAVPTTVDEAFDAMAQYMKVASRQCKRYHASKEPSTRETPGDYHCRHYHGDEFQPSLLRNPMRNMSKEDVHVKVAPGSYSVSAAREFGPTTTHVVHLKDGQALSVSLVLR